MIVLDKVFLNIEDCSGRNYTSKANQSTLRKTLFSVDDFLSTFLLLASDTKKEHTKYLFQHGNSSKDLPDMNSINFKCQQEKEKAKQRPLPIFFSQKRQN